MTTEISHSVPRTRSCDSPELAAFARWLSVFGAALRLSRTMELYQAPDPADLRPLGIEDQRLRLTAIAERRTSVPPHARHR